MSLYTYVYFCAHGIGVVAKYKKIAKKIKTEKGMKEKNKETTKEEQEKSEEMS